jgi:hypothetical protein
MALNALAPTADINTYILKANEQLSNPKYGKQFLNPDIFYSKQLLDTIRLDAKEYMYYRYADTQPISGKANKLQVRRWAPLQAHTVPLMEGVPPKSDKGSVEMYEIGTAQYGRYMEFSDVVDFKVVDPILAHYSREYSIVAIETLDLLAREALFAIANPVHAGYVANFEALTVDSRPTLTDLRKVTLSLKKQLVQPRSNGKYHVIAGPEFYFDMVSDPTVEKYMTINNTTKTMYDNSSLVPLFGMEFYETLACPTHGKFTKIVDRVAKKCLRLVEKTGNAYTYKTITEDDYMTTASGRTKILTKVSDYVKDSRTGENASYIPDQEIWNIDAFNDAVNKTSVSTSGSETVGNDGKIWYEFKAQHVLVLGKDALLRTGIEGQGNAKMYTKALGSAGVLDPIDQRQSIGFKINDVGFGSARLEAVTDYICVPSMVNEI